MTCSGIAPCFSSQGDPRSAETHSGTGRTRIIDGLSLQIHVKTFAAHCSVTLEQYDIYIHSWCINLTYRNTTLEISSSNYCPRLCACDKTCKVMPPHSSVETVGNEVALATCVPQAGKREAKNSSVGCQRCYVYRYSPYSNMETMGKQRVGTYRKRQAGKVYTNYHVFL